MKASELMIGDWVKINYRGKFVKVTAIHDGLIDTTAISPLMEDEYEPIPLTAEILHANFPNAYHNVFWYFNDRVSCETDFLYEIHIVKNIDEELTLNLRYVHELQHALRLCGIEKEIEL